MTTITIPRETFDAMLEALENIAGDKWPDPEMTAEEYAREALAAVKVVGEDKREAVTITSVKMVGGVAPEAELMRQAIAQFEGMGYRVEQDKAVQPQAQGLTSDAARAMVAEMDMNDRVLAAIDSEPQAQVEACEHGTAWDTVCRQCDDEAMSYHPYDHPDVRDLRKWLNEGQTREIDRHVLARVLAMLAHPQASEPALTENERIKAFLNKHKTSAFPKGECITCEGEGEIGGQFCGGYQACPDCSGSGKPAAPGVGP